MAEYRLVIDGAFGHGPWAGGTISKAIVMDEAKTELRNMFAKSRVPVLVVFANMKAQAKAHGRHAYAALFLAVDRIIVFNPLQFRAAKANDMHGIPEALQTFAGKSTKVWLLFGKQQAARKDCTLHACSWVEMLAGSNTAVQQLTEDFAENAVHF